MVVITFFVWRGGWVLQLHMATALDKSTRFLAAFLFVATTKAREKLNSCAKPKWKHMYTTTQASKRDEVALLLTNHEDELWA